MFSLHSVHAETVSAIVGRAELLAGMVTLASMLLCARVPTDNPWCGPVVLLIAAIGTVVSSLCTEAGMMTAILCVAVVHLRPRPPHTRPIAPSSPSQLPFHAMAISLAPIILMIRHQHGATFGTDSVFDNPVAHVTDRHTQILSTLYIFASNVRVLLFPDFLSCDWSGNTIELVTQWMDPRNVWTVSVIVGLLIAAVYASDHVLGLPRQMRMSLWLGIVLFLVAILPISHVLEPQGRPLALASIHTDCIHRLCPSRASLVSSIAGVRYSNHGSACTGRPECSLAQHTDHCCYSQHRYDIDADFFSVPGHSCCCDDRGHCVSLCSHGVS